ncbi:hypothetical protein ROTO_32620 [Roseovarius tolerans]|uniref:Uncharacterized protein n=1 Tax=Roseovarius tolerans TaxID=74031 RepID=A0A0L6CRC3_9RHOB|nr:hypothetical protein ROTO_32620 [Roseovarius tolerans]
MCHPVIDCRFEALTIRQRCCAVRNLNGQKIAFAQKVSREHILRMTIQFLGPTKLLNTTISQHCDAVRHSQRFVLIVGNEYEGYTKLGLQRFELLLHLLTKVFV